MEIGFLWPSLQEQTRDYVDVTFAKMADFCAFANNFGVRRQKLLDNYVNPLIFYSTLINLARELFDM